MTDHLQILLVMSDDQLAHQVQQKIKTKFAKVPLQFDTMSDAKLALGAFKSSRHAIVIAAAHLSGMDGLQLLREIKRIDGAVFTLLLGHSPEARAESIEALQLPIIDWTDFIGKVQAAIPDDLKARFGLFERNTLLFEKLTEYGKKYLIETAEVSRPAVFCIPKYFSSGVESQAEVPSQERQSQGLKKSAQSLIRYQALSIEQQKRTLKVEILILCVVLIITGGVFYFYREESSDGLLSPKGLATILSGVSFLGFFISRSFDRFLFAQDVDLQK